MRLASMRVLAAVSIALVFVLHEVVGRLQIAEE